MAMEPVAQEVFKQRLYELAKENEAKQPEDPPAREAPVTSGDDVLEGMLSDLLGALRREGPGDPFSAEKVAAINAKASEAVTAPSGSDPPKTAGTSADASEPPTKAENAAGAPEPTGLLAAIRAAGAVMQREEP
ncbi:unnamed protein product [Symbiodinium pilosum]|uniref:Uncharacterized protein n=1 Tax=Symbiodinium pilosum TaxID=2952 RepID=A0A812X8T8_SYMPI|nr:unnamed protein product [Symbiodinium pilosum]